MKQKLEEMIATLEVQKKAIDQVLEPLKQALKSLNSQPNLDELRAEAALIAKSTRTSAPRKARTITLYEQIAKYFAMNGNSPKTQREISEETGLDNNSLPNVLYTTHQHCFVKSQVEGYKNRIAWNLTPEAYESALQAVGE